MGFRGRLGTLFVVGLSAFCMSVQAQVVRPESVGLSSERLNRIEELMQRHIDANGFAGAVTVVARDNKVAWFHSQGMMDIAAGEAMREDAVFRIMSMTKPVVAFSILMMVEEGKVRLTDPVSRFIPSFEDMRVAANGNPEGVSASRDITVKDLLTHSSGLLSGPNDQYPVDFADGATLADVLADLGQVPLNFEPGTRWAYSAMFGFDVLAHIVEISSGLDFGTFVEERIFEPLDMDDTYFYGDGPHPNLAKLYRRTEQGELVENGDMAFVNGAYFSGGGGLFSTAEDYLQFALMLLNNGEHNGERLVGRRTAEMMHAEFLPDTLPGRGPGEGYGLGVRVVTDPAAGSTWVSEGAFGWSGAFNTHFFVDPQERIVGIYMTQIAGFPGAFTLMDDFETAVMQAIVD